MLDYLKLAWPAMVYALVGLALSAVAGGIVGVLIYVMGLAYASGYRSIVFLRTLLRDQRERREQEEWRAAWLAVSDR